MYYGSLCLINPSFVFRYIETCSVTFNCDVVYVTCLGEKSRLIVTNFRHKESLGNTNTI